jgi:hypothetical protein
VTRDDVNSNSNSNSNNNNNNNNNNPHNSRSKAPRKFTSKFSFQWLLRPVRPHKRTSWVFSSSGKWRYVARWVAPDVLEEGIAFIFQTCLIKTNKMQFSFLSYSNNLTSTCFE